MCSPKFLSRSIMVAWFCCLPAAAFPQERETLEEIIVTADYRARPIEEMPSSITILDAATISETAVQHFEELIGMLPNLN